MLTSKNLPLVLKGIASILDRAQEFHGRDRVVAYFCRRYALEQAVQRHGNVQDAAVLEFLGSFMDEIEQEKMALAGREEIADSMVGQAYVESFALKLFTKADDQDRAGRADKVVAKLFLAASVVMEVLNTFGDLSPDIEEKRKYAKYKAVYITKCLRDGITPVPGPLEQKDSTAQPNDLSTPLQPANLSLASQPALDSFGLPLPPGDHQQAAKPGPPTQSPEWGRTDRPQGSSSASTFQPVPPKNVGVQQTPASSSVQPVRQLGSQGTGSGIIPKGMEEVTEEDIKRVNKLCRFVMSSLQYDDIASAVKNLQDALALLTK